MATRPHDITDLYLAPVVLAVDTRIGELGRLDKDRLAYEVALESDSPDFTRVMREEALLRTVTHLIDTHDWKFSWDPRGLRLAHEAHTLVLGIPAVFLEYLEDSGDQKPRLILERAKPIVTAVSLRRPASRVPCAGQP